MISLEEYRGIVRTTLINDYRIDEDYVLKIDDDIVRSYNEGVGLSEQFGVDHINPGGYCYGIFMLYPDLP